MLDRSRRLLVALLLVLLAACSSDSGSTSSPTTTVATALPLDEQVLTVGWSADTYLATNANRPDIGKWPINARVADTLVNMNASFQLEPMLAESWELSADRNTWRFRLRRGVRFHDGQELTAEDVKYTFDLHARADARNLQQIGPDSTKIIDPYTVEVTPVRQNLRFVEQIVFPIFGINRKDSDPAKPVGTGPFRFVEYVKSDRLVVERFDGYWDAARVPKLKRITFRFLPDSQARILALRSGELQVIGDVLPDATTEVAAGGGGLRVERSASGAFVRVDFNIAGPDAYDLGRDPVVRQAVATAVDTKAVAQTVYQDNADPNPLSPQLFGNLASNVKAVASNPAEARRLLEAEGWALGGDGIRAKDGRRLSLAYLTLFPTAQGRLIGEVLQNQLKGVGIELRIEQVADAAVSSTRRNNGEYDLLQQGGAQNDGNPCQFFDLLYASPAIGGRPSNRFTGPGGKTDESIQACRSAATTEAVRQASVDAARQLIEVERASIPIAAPRQLWALKDNVRDFMPHPGQGRANLESVFLTR